MNPTQSIPIGKIAFCREVGCIIEVTFFKSNLIGQNLLIPRRQRWVEIAIINNFIIETEIELDLTDKSEIVVLRLKD